MERTRHQAHPARIAMVLSLTYTILCAVYIFVSTSLAARHADSLDTLARIEQWKGVVFILITAGIFYGFAYVVLKKISRQEEMLREQEASLLKADRLNLAGAMAMTVAHDMNNQITILSMGMEELRLTAPAANPETMRCLRTAVEQLGELSHQLLATGRQRRDTEMAEVNLRHLAEISIDMAQRHPRVASCALILSMPDVLPARVIHSLVSHMLMNAILNAADATQGGGRIEIRGLIAGDQVTLEIHDNGPGIPEEQRADVVKPFYTTKSHGHGLGFMSMDYCARMHDGTLSIDRSDLGGCCVRVTFPRV